MKISTSPLQRSAVGALLLSQLLTLAAFAQGAGPANAPANDRPTSDQTTPSSRAADTGTMNGSVNDNATAKLDWSDKRFITKAAKSGMEEVTLSQIAAERATDPDVKALAQRIVADHQGVNGQLTALASSRGVSLSDNMDKHDTKLAAKWQKKEQGREFDRDYIKEMVSAHEDAIELFGKAAKSEDPQIAALASKTLAPLQEHYTRAQELQKRLQ